MSGAMIGSTAMRHLVFSLAAVGILATQQARAQLHCLTPEERSAVEIAALRSELMVLATGCREDDRYNAFVRKYQSDLIGNEKAIGEMLRRKHGKRAQQEHDRFSTEMANAESTAGMRLGSDFCPRNAALFSEVMALSSASDLAAYAAGKDLVPATMEICAGPAKPAAPATRKAAPAKRN
jgi:hypothetical protein